MFRCFDIGWRDNSGNHGLIAAHGGDLGAAEASPLLKWTDITRQQFQLHWFFVALCPGTMALIRVCPMAHGLRGVASYSHAVLFEPLRLPWCMDISALLRVFPPLPSQIGQPSVWQSVDALAQADVVVMRTEVAEHAQLLCAVFEEKPVLEKVRWVDCDATLDQAAQIRLILKTFSLLPRNFQERELYFATSDAPGFAKPFFILHPGAAPRGPCNSGGASWLELLNEKGMPPWNDDGPRWPSAIFNQWVKKLVADDGRSLSQRVDALIGQLLAVPFPGADDDKFDAVEVSLRDLHRDKGKFIYALMERLRQRPVEGVQILWILRLMADVQALIELDVGQRFKIFTALARELPNELLNILDGLVPSELPSLVASLKEVVGGQLKNRSDRMSLRTPGFLRLFENVLRHCLVDAVHLDYENRCIAISTALGVLDDAMSGNVEVPADLAAAAGRVLNAVVSNGPVLAVNLQILAIGGSRLMKYMDGWKAACRAWRILLRHAVAADRETAHGLSRLLAAIQWEYRQGNGTPVVLDGFRCFLPREELIWLPMLQACLGKPNFNAGTRRNSP